MYTLYILARLDVHQCSNFFFTFVPQQLLKVKQLSGVSLLLQQYESCGLNLGCQAWCQGPLLLSHLDAPKEHLKMF